MRDTKNISRTGALAGIRVAIREWALSAFTVFIGGTALLMWPLALWRDASGVEAEWIWLPLLALVFALSRPGRSLARKWRSRDIH
jgi:hypothetical protein